MMGPVIIFDKSVLQSLNPDESMWLDNFFISNITPLFFVETLADLEKEMKAGKKPEDIVGGLAYKTPDMGCVNVHHRSLIAGELMNKGKILADGRPVLPRGRTIELEGKTGVIIAEAPEIEASKRWQKREFLSIERDMAKDWREEIASLQDIDRSDFDNFFSALGKPKNFTELKQIVDKIIDLPPSEQSMTLCMTFLGLRPEGQQKILEEWKNDGSKPIREYAPYTSYVLSVDLFFYVGSGAGLFDSFPHAKTHRIDFIYLYYLPFTKIFTSNDKLHTAIVPMFMQPDQTYISGIDLKNDLSRLDAFYDKLPQEVKNRGVVSFAPCPPDDVSFLTTRMWDKYMAKTWRNIKNSVRKFDGTDKVDVEKEKKALEYLKKFIKEGKTIKDSDVSNSDKTDSMVLRHMVSARRGKWEKFPPEIRNSKPLFE